MKKNYFHLYPKRFYKKPIFFYLAISLLSLYSCKKTDNIDIDLQVESDKLNLLSQDTTTLVTYTIREDSIRSDETSYNLLGSYVDPVFGFTEASIYTQFRLFSENYNIGNSSELVLDSVVLSLVYAGIYGDSSQQQIKVYQLTEDIYTDSTYYSNRKLNYSSSSIASAFYVPHLFDSVTVNGKKEPAQLRVALDNAFGEQLLKSASTTNTNFISQFKGLYITSENFSSQTAIVYFDLLSTYSKITLFYRNTVQGNNYTFNLLIDKNCARINHFKHDYNGSPLQMYINDTLLGKYKVYVQSMAGVKTKVEFPFLPHYFDSGLVIINKAELVLTIDDNSSYFPPHTKLYAVGIDSAGKNQFLPDQLEGDAHYGGSFNSSTNEYRFNITRHVQRAIQDKTDNFDLYIIASGSAINANRVILKGSNATTSNMRLILAYTRL